MERSKDLDRLAVSVEEAGKLLGVSRRVAYDLAKGADFPVLSVGRRKLVSVQGLQRWVEARTAHASED